MKGINKNVGGHTNEAINFELRRTRGWINELNQEKLRLKYDYDLEKDLIYRKMIDDKHVESLIEMAEYSPNPNVQRWGDKLRALKLQDSYV